MAKSPSPEPFSYIETARCAVNKATRRRIRKALTANRGIDLSAVLRRVLPTFPSSEIAVIHPVSDTVQEYILGKGPQRHPDETPWDAVETGHEIAAAIDMLERHG